MNNTFDYLKVQGFRGLKSLELSDLGKVNIFVGDNNSGKTSLLEAISIFCNPLDQLHWIGVSQRRSFVGRTVLPVRPNSEPVKWIFLQENKLISNDEAYQGEIMIDAKGNTPIIKLETRLSELYSSGIETSTSRRLSDDETLNEYIKSGIELEVIVSPAIIQGDIFNSVGLTKVSIPFWDGERIIMRKRPKPYVKW